MVVCCQLLPTWVCNFIHYIVRNGLFVIFLLLISLISICLQSICGILWNQAWCLVHGSLGGNSKLKPVMWVVITMETLCLLICRKHHRYLVFLWLLLVSYSYPLSLASSLSSPLLIHIWSLTLGSVHVYQHLAEAPLICCSSACSFSVTRLLHWCNIFLMIPSFWCIGLCEVKCRFWFVRSSKDGNQPSRPSSNVTLMFCSPPSLSSSNVTLMFCNPPFFSSSNVTLMFCNPPSLSFSNVTLMYGNLPYFSSFDVTLILPVSSIWMVCIVSYGAWHS